jgi:tRNA threonylcarbamoyl adenosine modification protein YeaZ
MTVLAIDTSCILGGIALARDGRVLGEILTDARAATSERIVPQIEELLSTHGIRPLEIGRVAVALGPGSFTGLRVGLATAKGLAIGLGVPLAAISSSEARAATLGAGDRAVLVVAAHRRGEVFSRAGWSDGSAFHDLLEEASRPIAEAPVWVREAHAAAVRAGRLPLFCTGDAAAAVHCVAVDSGAWDPPGSLLLAAGRGAGAIPGAIAALAERLPEDRLLSGDALDELEPRYLPGTVARRRAGR